MTLKDATVLFVEDEPFLRESMGAWLERRAGRAICAEHGEAALAILTAEKVHLVVTDVRMPVMDGLALVARLRQTSSTTPVILVTGFSDLSLREAYELGVDAVVEKPIDREELLRAMKNCLADPEQLWRQPISNTADAALHATFTSFATARADNSFAFGRRGFCIKSTEVLHEGPVDFRLTFVHDQRILAGQGVARWIDCPEGRAGIEIIRLEEDSLKWALDAIRETAATAVVPDCLKSTRLEAGVRRTN